jgi:cyclopropane-fatty-acyl-phospholipid synthase
MQFRRVIIGWRNQVFCAGAGFDTNMTGKNKTVSGAVKRLDTLKRLLIHMSERLSFDVAFYLWDGSTVPIHASASELAIVIADEGAIAALVRRPKLDTLINLWVSARLDIRNGSIFDLVARRPKVRTKATLKALDKRLALSTAASFLFIARGGPWPLENVHGERAKADGTEAANKENISYHYDLSNAFYAFFLDPEMVYSCAYFREGANDLATAQRDKLDMICRKLRLKAGETLLDIGCGWGGLACYAARHYGVLVHGVTLSQEQYAYAREKVRRLGLEERITLELRDYSQIDGSFDKIASIGTFEHIGIANHPTYFQTVHRLLRPRGLYLHHAIVRRPPRNNRRRERLRPEQVALARYIFPGGEIDHLGMSIANLARHGFEVHDVEGWREHYARTTRLWHDRLLAHRVVAEREVGSVKVRLWLAYLAGCSLAFEHGHASVFQTLASKRARGSSGLPLTRADLYA